MNESRNHIVKFRVDDVELNYLKEKMQLAKCKSMSDFLRRISLGGRIYVIDTSEITDIKKLTKKISDNINQIAMRINFQKTIYREDIEEIQYKIGELYKQQNRIETLLDKLKSAN